MLTTCKDCGGRVSATAPACPHCGRPQGKRRTQTVELTGKPWKLLTALASLSLFASTAALLANQWRVIPDSQTTTVAAAAIAVSLLVLLIARVGAWWFHA